VAAIFASIFIWNEFLVGLYIINTNSLQTVPIGAAGLISAQRPIDWSIAATVGVVTIVPIFIFSLFAQRWVVRGVTAGALR
jgi:ABC-type glycerol-3-phosphate transport system permease component